MIRLVSGLLASLLLLSGTIILTTFVYHQFFWSGDMMPVSR